MKCYFTLVLGLLASILSACNSDSGGRETTAAAEEIENGVNGKDKWNTEGERIFLKEAYLNNKLIVGYSEMAWQQAQTTALRDFANQTVPYYKNLNAQIEKRDKNAAVAWQHEEIEEQSMKDLENLQKLQGKEFEVAYLKRLKKVLDIQARLFGKAAENGSNDEIRNWAAKITSNLESHLIAVEELREDIK